VWVFIGVCVGVRVVCEGCVCALEFVCVVCVRVCVGVVVYVCVLRVVCVRL